MFLGDVPLETDSAMSVRDEVSLWYLHSPPQNLCRDSHTILNKIYILLSRHFHIEFIYNTSQITCEWYSVFQRCFHCVSDVRILALTCFYICAVLPSSVYSYILLRCLNQHTSFRQHIYFILFIYHKRVNLYCPYKILKCALFTFSYPFSQPSFFSRSLHFMFVYHTNRKLNILLLI